MNKKTFKEGLSALVQAYPSRKFEPEICWMLLQDLEDNAFMKAIVWITQGQEELYPGTNIIAKIRKKALDVLNITAGEAWSEVISEISRVGHTGKPKFSSPLVEKAVNCIGWRSMCVSECIGVERAHFFKAYDQLSSRQEESDLINPDYKKLVSSVIKSIENKK